MKNLMNNRKKILIAMAIIFCVGIVCCIYFLESKDRNSNVENITESGIIESETKNSNNIKSDDEHHKDTEEIYIHIIGEVQNPGVITLPKGSRIADAIEKAGGITESADVSKINLVYILSDGQKLKIPSIYDEKNDQENYIITSTEGNIIHGETNGKEIKGKININTASQTELETITGVGPSLASKIITYRKKNGKFKTIEELKNVSGIGDSKFETIKEEIEI